MQSKAERQHDVNAGCAPYDPRSEGCVKLWIAAVKLYASDCITAANGRYNVDDGRALRDLRSDEQRYLHILCEPLGADAEAVARAIEWCIAENCGAGLHKPRSKPARQQKRAA